MTFPSPENSNEHNNDSNPYLAAYMDGQTTRDWLEREHEHVKVTLLKVRKREREIFRALHAIAEVEVGIMAELSGEE